MPPAQRILGSLGVAVLIGCLSSGASATELVINGGFESGDLTGWNGINTTVEPSHAGVLPNNGSHMAVMGIGAGSSLPDKDAALVQTVSLDTGVVSKVDLSFAYNLQALDLSPAVDFGTDSLIVALIPIAAPASALPLLEISLNDMYDGLVSDVLGWTTFSQTFSNIPDIGVVDLAFTFLLQNTRQLGLKGDEGQLLAAYIDDVSVIVPAPPALLLLSIGLVVLAPFNRIAGRS